jgi:hypothetical protein
LVLADGWRQAFIIKLYYSQFFLFSDTVMLGAKRLVVQAQLVGSSDEILLLRSNNDKLIRPMRVSLIGAERA